MPTSFKPEGTHRGGATDHHPHKKDTCFSLQGPGVVSCFAHWGLYSLSITTPRESNRDFLDGLLKFRSARATLSSQEARTISSSLLYYSMRGNHSSSNWNYCCQHNNNNTIIDTSYWPPKIHSNSRSSSSSCGNDKDHVKHDKWLKWK